MTKLDRLVGSFGPMYKQAVLTHLIKHLTGSYGSSLSYFNFIGGSPGYQLKESHTHKDALWLYKWLRSPIGQRNIPAAIDNIKPWLEEFAEVNEDVPVDKYGFPQDLYFPGNDLIVHKYLRPRDRAYIFEPREEPHEMLNAVLGDDPRVKLYKEGPDTEAFMKSIIPPPTTRAFFHFDLNENTTYIQQLRARNTLFACMKRMPHATYMVSWPVHGDNFPWLVMEAFAQTGYHNAYASVQFADQSYVERKVTEAYLNNNQGSDEFNQFVAENGNGNASQFHPIMTPDESSWWPATMKAFQPGDSWEGVGVAVLNAGKSYGGLLQGIGEGLRTILNKPNGMIYGRSGPLYQPHTNELGATWGQRISYTNPGISVPEDWQFASTTDMAAQVDRGFVDHLMGKLDYIPLGKKDTPQTQGDIENEYYKPTVQGERLAFPTPFKKRTASAEKKYDIRDIFSSIETYAKTKALMESTPEVLAEYNFTNSDNVHSKKGLNPYSMVTYADLDEINIEGKVAGIERRQEMAKAVAAYKKSQEDKKTNENE